MKRYLVFYGDIYYPGQGMVDFVCDFDTLAEAQARIVVEREKKGDSVFKWGQIYDSETRTIVFQKHFMCHPDGPEN